MNDIEIKNKIKSAQKGDERPFNIFFEYAFQKLRGKLLSLTKSEEDTREVFITSMQKFWERFVINQEELPHNSIGYIYIMCKNAWLMKKRNIKGLVTVSDQPYEYHDDTEAPVSYEDQTEIENDRVLKHKALAIALEKLSPKCKTLLENDMDHQVQLKDLQQELGYTNYQALVQAKYNCKKRLIQKVYEALEKLKKHN
ncbi:RNA polymerase sigma factor [Aquimarina aquimarini]|uniref:RNA polymerase sigma factor n=1 Tax=Aquimarina aquimarini TaxID=1191734 RepID=UPI000D54C60C|nr:sigma-70 family RNA polymerase sigma factor [Aquimarina aquimarini]